MTDKMSSTRHQMRQDMFNSMRELLGSGYIKEHYINCMADFVDIAEWYAEQKHAEEIAALKAEHRAEMAGLCDEIESTLTGIRGIDSYCSGWNGCSNEVRRNLKLIKQRISDE